MTLDHLQAIFWSITYVFLIAYALKNKHYGIPLIPLALNYAWETVALFTTILFNRSVVSYLMHGIWFALDTVIAILFLKNNSISRKKKIFIIIYLLALIIFLLISSDNQHFFVAAYYIDFFMAVEFIMFALFEELRKDLLACEVAIFKLLGDLCAWLNLYGVHLLSITVLLCNGIYLVIILSKKSNHPPFTNRPLRLLF